ncbi:MAG: transglycosylase SLT domain-containing protein [Bosea sp.]|uniref:lytic transglycosylase domain-containing protein n=1 Tax=Bosea sp. (in: a-proteobacteria) TaxID=1871050 RepID=UPI001AC121D0|nr:transglycosylase SLT domain-containing protein [Bosea sp. (in: a-proteobacteria)]MBN9451159.1 transglycosylase SLT domain-containing protein [Bosea sp. (in: a-proteobacteria)]
MRYICGGLAAACLISLSGVALAEDFVNAETDPRAIVLRDAEIARAKAAEGKGEEVQAEASKTKPATRVAKVESDKTETRASRALAAPAGSEGIKAIVARHAAANGVPFSLADAVVRVESRYNPRASHAGNYGLMQIRHQTARGMGYSGGPGGLLDAETNARYGMKYLALAYKLAGGDTCRTIMKYQSGHMATRMSGANRTYCAKVRTITARN